MAARDYDDDLLLLVGRIDANVIQLLEQAKAHGARLSELESWKSKLIGIALGAGTLAGGAAAKLAAIASASPLAHP